MSEIYDFKLKSLSGGTVDFADFKGKKILIVNTASECGYTSQYAQLQELHEKMSETVVVIGCPCNQFGGQEPGTAATIQNFCESRYGVTFPLTEKLDVKGKNAHPLYQWLTQKEKNGKGDFTVSWNFNKFLVSEEGELVGHFGSGVSGFEVVAQTY